MVIDVRVELDEVGRGVGVALPARGQPIGAGHAGGRIGNVLDVVGAVAVEAVGSRLIAQLGQFAVNAHGVTAGKIGVAIAAEIGELAAESGRGGQDDFVPLVTGGAARPLLRFSARRQPLGHFTRSAAPTVDAGLQPFGDKAVALAAGVGDVGR